MPADLIIVMMRSDNINIAVGMQAEEPGRAWLGDENIARSSGRRPPHCERISATKCGCYCDAVSLCRGFETCASRVLERVEV
jgi:hypothetical protein